MISFLKNKASIIAFLIILITSIFYSYEFRVKDNAWKQIVNADGRGYYGYLPAIFIYQDWNWDFIYEQEKLIISDNPAALGDYLNIVEGEKVNRYFVGTAILMAPFFLLGYAYSAIFGLPIDGYSFPFFISILVSTLFYFLLGINYMRKTLLLYGFSNVTISIVLLAFGLGSNLFYYANYETSMSHVYSFALIAGFCYYSKKISVEYSNKTLFLLITVFSLIVVSRPVNGLVLLVLPFFFTSLFSFFDFCKKVFSNYRTLLLSLIIAALILSLQVFAYYMQTGKYWIYAYNDAKFNFNDPYFFQILFGFRKGLFVYTPITFFSILGLVFLFRKNTYQAFVWLVFFLTTNYVLSSWSYWWYGGCFGLRAYVEFFPLFMILLANAISEVRWYKFLLIIIVPLCIVLNFIQMYQYQNYILHWDEMDKEKYWNVFLKTDDIYRGALWEKEYVDYYKDIINNKIIETTNTFDEYDEYWTSNNTITNFNNSFSGNKVSKIGKNNVYGELFSFNVEQSYPSLIIKTSSNFLLTSQKSRGRIVVTLEKNGEIKDYNFRLTHSVFDNILPNNWYQHSYNLSLGDLEYGDVVKVYYMNDGEDDLFVDDFKISIHKDSNIREPKSKAFFIERIKESPEWIKLIEDKARSAKIPLDAMILLDAEYLEYEDKELIKIESEILKNKDLCEELKNRAESKNTLFSEELTGEAKKIYNQKTQN